MSRRKIHAPAIAYRERRISEGECQREAMRCLERYLARHFFWLMEAQALTRQSQTHHRSPRQAHVPSAPTRIVVGCCVAYRSPGVNPYGMPTTPTGTRLTSGEPSPSWPYPFKPQHSTVPSEISEQVWSGPALIWLASVMPLTATGVELSVVVPLPS
jgi:hypothetical protein